jgi:hypothetical protein
LQGAQGLNSRKPQKLRKNDGTVVRQIVESVRIPEPQLAEENNTLWDGTLMLTGRSFLSANAMRSNERDGRRGLLLEQQLHAVRRAS